MMFPVRDLGTRIDVTPRGLRATEIEPPAVLHPLVEANTRGVGYAGLLLVIVSAVVIAQYAAIAHVFAGRPPPLSVPAGLAVIGGLLALLGRWRTFYE